MNIHSHGRWERGSERSLYAPNGQRKYLNAEERRRFLEAAALADPVTRSLCLTLAYTGCRISEALSLTGSSVQVSEGLIAIRSLKKRGRLYVREVPVPNAIARAITQTSSVRPEQTTPTVRSDARLYPFGRTEAWKRVKVVMESANVAGPQASPRGLRHGFAVSAILAGVPLNIVQKWLGHATINTTAIYANAVGAEERELAKLIWRAESDNEV